MIYVNDSIETYNHAMFEEMLLQVSEQRKSAIGKLARFQDKLLSVLVFRLLQEALECEYGLKQVPPFAYTPYGKPFFPTHPHIHFSLSHCDHAVACVVGADPIGIDAECIRPFDKDLAAYISSPQEYESIIGNRNPEVAFTVLWTRKESLCKKNGSGLPERRELQYMLENHDCNFQTSVNLQRKYVVTCCHPPLNNF